MRPTFTLDTNALLDIALGREAVGDLLALVDLHRAGKIDLAITGMSAAERQPGRRYIANFQEFLDRLESLGLQDLTILKPMCVVGVSYVNWSVYGSEELDVLRQNLSRVLWPEMQPYREYCEAKGIDPAADPMDRLYRNRLLDVLILHTHIMHGRDVFVSRDDNYFAETKLPHLEALGAKAIRRPAEALEIAKEAAS